MIDIHMHIGRWGSKREPAVDAAELIRRMDELGIEKTVLLPVGVSPESFFLDSGNREVLDAYHQHPTRFIPFCNLDPRSGNSAALDFSWVLEEFKAAGCRGVGELTANMLLDDPRCLNLFHHCGAVGLPALIHVAVAVAEGLYGLADDKGLPRLERALRECPQTTFIGHAQTFWAEMSADVEEKDRGGYPAGPVRAPGRVSELLARYPNLYADLSAGSGFSAISRDPEFGYRFLEEHQDKLLFGTDICHVNQPVEVVPYINAARQEGRISEECYRKVTRGNAVRVLGMDA
jgi:predicted TIM-barrel fold metal-dependent hydrolase